MKKTWNKPVLFTMEENELKQEIVCAARSEICPFFVLR